MRSFPFLLVACAFLTSRCPGQAAEPAPINLLVPAYFYPAGEGLAAWQRLAKDAESYPGQVVAIVNPASGPGTEVDTNYSTLLRNLEPSRLRRIGYVTSSYAGKPVREVMAEVDRWFAMYPGITGIFVDEQASGADSVAYYEALARHIRARQPGALIVNNPGTSCHGDYLARNTADVICVQEGPTGLRPSALPAWMRERPGAGRRACVLLHTVPGESVMHENLNALRAVGVAWVYVTDHIMPNPWDRLPVYWEAELKSLRSAP